MATTNHSQRLTTELSVRYSYIRRCHHFVQNQLVFYVLEHTRKAGNQLDTVPLTLVTP